MPIAKSHDGVEIHYKTHGRGPFQLIFLHGWGGSGETWEKVFGNLDPEMFRAIRLDLRGHGLSAKPAFGYTWEQFDQDVLAVADQESLTRFVPVGFSLGGKLSAYLAALYPHRVLAQILVAPVGPGLVPIERSIGLQVCREANDKSKARAFFRNWFAPEATEGIVDGCCSAIAETPAHVLKATAEMILWTSIEPIVSRLQQPTLLVLGTSDPVYGETYQRERVVPFLANVHTTYISSGHFLPLERPADLARSLSEFLLRCAS